MIRRDANNETENKRCRVDITNGTLIAIPVPWESSPSGCVEMRLVDWTVENDGGQRLPILVEQGAWGYDYALRASKTAADAFPTASVAMTKAWPPCSHAAGPDTKHGDDEPWVKGEGWQCERLS